MSFAPHCGHFLLYKEFIRKLKKKIGTEEKITTPFHLKEIYIKNVKIIIIDNKNNFMK